MSLKVTEFFPEKIGILFYIKEKEEREGEKEERLYYLVETFMCVQTHKHTLSGGTGENEPETIKMLGR